MWAPGETKKTILNELKPFRNRATSLQPYYSRTDLATSDLVIDYGSGRDTVRHSGVPDWRSCLVAAGRGETILTLFGDGCDCRFGEVGPISIQSRTFEALMDAHNGRVRLRHR
jgi:hypothetical protein